MSPQAIAPPSSSCTDPARRSVLVADDDASSRHFLAGAIESLGFVATCAADGIEALAMARTTCFGALLLDCRMPGAGALAVLTSLRSDPLAASKDAVALATSAEVPGSLREELLRAGFAGVIEKPCAIASLGHALGATLGIDPEVCILDDREGLVATGDATTMRALRALLHHELMQLATELDSLSNDPRELIDRLHRLLSACGFCGAPRLAAQAKALQRHTFETGCAVPASMARFRHELTATLEALAEDIGHPDSQVAMPYSRQ